MQKNFNKLSAAIALATVAATASGIANANARGVVYEKESYDNRSVTVANGIFWGRYGVNEGNIVSISGFNQAVQLIDPDTGERLRTYGPLNGVIAPDDGAEDPEGNIWIGSLVTGEITKIAQDGTFEHVAEGFEAINPMAISATGDLMYFGMAIAEDRLWRWDLSDPEAEPILVAEHVGWPNSMQFSPIDGDLYSPINLYGEIMRWDRDSLTGEREVVFEGLEFPASIEFDDAGNIYVVEFLTGLISKLDLDSGEKEVWADLNPGLDNVAVSPDGRVFGSEFPADAIVEAYPPNPDGSLVEPRLVGEPSGGMMPDAMIFIGEGEDERLLFKDTFFIWDIDRETQERELLASAGFLEQVGAAEASGLYDNDRLNHNDSGVGRLFFTQSMNAVDDGDSAVIISGGFVGPAGGIMVYDLDADEVTRAELYENRPFDAVMVGGDIYYTSVLENAVFKVAPDGTRTRVMRTLYPLQMAATDDDVWVADFILGTVYQIVKDGRELLLPRITAVGLRGPEGMTVANDGNLLVVESRADRLTKVNLRTRRKTVIAEDLGVNDVPATYEPMGSHSLVAAVAESEDGTIFVGATGLRPRQLITLTPECQNPRKELVTVERRNGTSHLRCKRARRR